MTDQYPSSLLSHVDYVIHLPRRWRFDPHPFTFWHVKCPCATWTLVPKLLPVVKFPAQYDMHRNMSVCAWMGEWASTGSSSPWNFTEQYSNSLWPCIKQKKKRKMMIVVNSILNVLCVGRFMLMWRTHGTRRRFGGWRCTCPLGSWALDFCLCWRSPPSPLSAIRSTGGNLASYRYKHLV